MKTYVVGTQENLSMVGIPTTHFHGETRKDVWASVAQSDAYPNGDQNVTGLIPARSVNSFSWRLIMKYFLWSFSLFH